MKELEELLGYRFRDPALLTLALTHSSYGNEQGDRCDNERLEFLGDSVLGFLTAEYLFKTFGDLPEGELTKHRANAVCEKTLAEYARQIKLGDYLRLGKGEQRTGGANRPSILSDAFESVIAAISGWLLLNESFTLTEGIGCALVFGAIMLTQIPVKSIKKAP